MSAEEAATDALQTPLDPNAQAAADAKKLLAELQNDAVPAEGAKPTNGAADAVKATDAGETKVEEGAQKESAEDKESEDAPRDSDRRRDGRHNGRSDHGRSDHSGRGRGRGRGRGGGGGGGDRNGHSHRNYRDNIKSDVTTQEESSDPIAIRKQVEFYFSDSNLPADKHLLERTGGSENIPFPLADIHTFKRMRHFQPFSAIVDALRESTFLELADDDTTVRRRVPWVQSLDDTPKTRRSIYAKGFGDEIPSTQFDIEAFFATFGPTNEVRLRRSDDKHFKGSVFVEFETEDLAKAFLTQENKPKYNGKELQIMSKKEYCDGKKDDIESGKVKPNGFKRSDRDRRPDSRRKRDDDDDRDWRTRRDEDRKRGFKDDKRHGGDRRRGAGYGGGRSSAPTTDEKGIPTIKATAGKRDSGRDDALAKARAAVEAENQKEGDQESGTTVEQASESKKRAREDDGDAEAAHEAKKVDTKVDAEAAS